MLRRVMAQDKRVLDRDGHLSVSNNVLTAVGISAYLGREIPQAAELGLDLDRQYLLFRPPGELMRAAKGLTGKPILMQHQPISATDHPRQLVVGAVGDVSFDGSKVTGSLTFWDDSAIAGVANDEVRDLSCGYYYVAKFLPGNWHGQRYDAVMTNLSFNHVAVVPKGRVPGAMVGDAAKGSTAMESDTPLSKLQLFVQDKLNDEDQATFEDLLQQFTESLTGEPQMSLDALKRQAAVRRRLRDDGGFHRRFPGASNTRLLG